MASRRQEQVSELIREELSVLIARQVNDPRVHSLTSITTVEASPDLRHARVFISVLGSENEQLETLKALRAASGFLRRQLAERVRLRSVPELDVRLDTSIQRGERIIDLLRKLEREEAKHRPTRPSGEVTGDDR